MQSAETDAFRIRDNTRAVAFVVDEDGNTTVGGAKFVAAPDRFRILDNLGRLAFEVGSDGKTFITDVEILSTVTRVHVLSGIGQSNMSGFGRPVSADLDPADSRIFQYGANSGATSGIRPATVPLDFNGGPNRLSPLTVIAREYVNTLPDGHIVLLVPAAKGSTGLVNDATGGC